MDSFKEKIKTMFKGSKNKSIENVVAFIIILIATIFVINFIWADEENLDNTITQLSENVSNVTYNEGSNNELEQQIKNIIMKIDGVGKADVLITYSESDEIVVLYNESTKESQTEETDTSGGTRIIEEIDSEKEVVYKEENGNKVPITEKVIMPKIEGALVVAEGADNAIVKSNIISAIEVLTGLATHKIQVLCMKK